MGPSIEELYQRIAEKITTIIDDDWSQTVVKVEIGDGVYQLQGTYRTDLAEGSSQSFAADFELAMLFQQLLVAMVEAGEEPWKEASFSLDRDGKFHIAFSR